MKILWVSSALVALVQSHESTLGLHGSGTTNPSKCYWAILEQMAARSMHPMRLTYRGIGSSTGQQEFMQSPPIIDFSSGDIPFSSEDYNTLLANNDQVLHLPVLLGAVSLFHSVPGLANGEDLNLNACLLARIFTRDITTWNHPDIIAMNPTLKTNLPITVAVRSNGSSSSYAVTNYLRTACPEHFPAELASDLPAWPAQHVGVEGSAQMAQAILDKPGTLGYIDAGHGHALNLPELELENADGTWLTSKQAAARGGIAAAEEGVFPNSTAADFSSVNLLNRPGPNTWPIVLATYIYVRQDLTHIADANERTLLIAFLKALQMEEYVGQCRDEYDFTIPSGQAKELVTAAISDLEAAQNASAAVWKFETDILPIEGAGLYTISSKRSEISDVEIAALQDAVATMKEQLSAIQNSEAAWTSGGSEDTQVKAALVLSSLSFVFWIMFVCFYGIRWIRKP